MGEGNRAATSRIQIKVNFGLGAVQPFVSRVWAAGYAHTYATASDAYMQYSTVTARIVLLSLT